MRDSVRKQKACSHGQVCLPELSRQTRCAQGDVGEIESGKNALASWMGTYGRLPRSSHPYDRWDHFQAYYREGLRRALLEFYGRPSESATLCGTHAEHNRGLSVRSCSEGGRGAAPTPYSVLALFTMLSASTSSRPFTASPDESASMQRTTRLFRAKASLRGAMCTSGQPMAVPDVSDERPAHRRQRSDDPESPPRVPNLEVC